MRGFKDTINHYKSYRAYCEKYGNKKGDALIGMLKDVIIGNLSENETIAMLDADTVVSIIKKKDCNCSEP